MTQTVSSRKRNRELEDSDLLPSPKRTDFNLNSSLQVNGHLNGIEEADGSSGFLQNGACYNGQPAPAQPHPQPHHLTSQQPAPSILHQHMNSHSQVPPNNPNSGKDVTYLDSSTCAALSNLHLMSGDRTEAPSCSNQMPASDDSVYRDINRVLREAHFSRLSRLNGTFGE
ncbi:uncharacterized protein LOC119738821 isoform X2 [Patiria miniata]|uniref:Uncharacterized protein n=1 Tax=Patiria miniata TaxID=46514 RepID=A0A914B2I8_PATMI|nr:uncharacterized protein LOC119738821 isoform X2 [Patiria miniata]